MSESKEKKQRKPINKKLQKFNKEYFEGRINPIKFCEDCNWEQKKPTYCSKCSNKLMNKLNGVLK